MFEFENEHLEEPKATRYGLVFDECADIGLGLLVWVLLPKFETWSRERSAILLDDILCISCDGYVCDILRAFYSQDSKHHYANSPGFHQ